MRIRRSFIFVFITFGILLHLNDIFAQSSSNTNNNSKTYKVQKGEGLYRISVKLGTTIDELIRLNPSLQNGISEGQVILVPDGATDKGTQTSIQSDQNFILHTVEKGQTLFSLSQKYDLPIEIIIQNNPGVERGLVEGTTIRIPKDTQVEAYQTKRSNEYIYYTILPKETLYGISKKFNCAVNEIVEANPGINSQSLQVGNELRIPKNKSIASSLNSVESAPLAKKGSLYGVKRKDTANSIARKFSITVDDLKRANPQVDMTSLRVGQQLLIPAIEESKATAVLESVPVEATPETSNAEVLIQASKKRCNPFSYSSNPIKFKIALLLPFAASDNLNGLNDSSNPVPLSTVSKIFLEYYEGTLLALDKIKSEGVNVECFVYDTWPDSTKIKQILAKPEMKQMNLIFGPAYAVNLAKVSDFAKENKIPLIYPLSSKNYELSENPYLFQINSSDSVIYDNVGIYLAQQSGSKIITIMSQNPSLKERDIITKIKKSYTNKATNGSAFISLDFEPMGGFDKLVSALDNTRENIIFIPSEKESDVSQIINSVHGALKRSTARIKIVGMPEWLKYQTINAEDVHACNTFIFTRSAIDYYDGYTQSLIKEYRLLYKNEPLAFSPYFQYGSKNPNFSRYGLLGYDLTYYFLSALKEFGPDFENCLDGFRPKMIQSNFIFKRIGNWGGFYDDGLFLVNFRPDFKINRITLY